MQESAESDVGHLQRSSDPLHEPATEIGHFATRLQEHTQPWDESRVSPSTVVPDESWAPSPERARPESPDHTPTRPHSALAAARLRQKQLKLSQQRNEVDDRIWERLGQLSVDASCAEDLPPRRPTTS